MCPLCLSVPHPLLQNYAKGCAISCVTWDGEDMVERMLHMGQKRENGGTTELSSYLQKVVLAPMELGETSVKF